MVVEIVALCSNTEHCLRRCVKRTTDNQKKKFFWCFVPFFRFSSDSFCAVFGDPGHHQCNSVDFYWSNKALDKQILWKTCDELRVSSLSTTSDVNEIRFYGTAPRAPQNNHELTAKEKSIHFFFSQMKSCHRRHCSIEMLIQVLFQWKWNRLKNEKAVNLSRKKSEKNAKKGLFGICDF